MKPWVKKMSVILIPEGAAKTYSFQMHTVVLAAASLGVVVLLGMAVTLLFSQGRLFLVLRENSSLKREVRMLHVEVEKVRTLEEQLRYAEATRNRVLMLLGATGHSLDSLNAGGVALAASTSDEIRLSQEDYFRAVPTSWPTRGPITRVYKDASQFGAEHHPGIDIAAKEGTAVRAAAAGTVSFAGTDPEYGELLIVEHGMGFETRYAHNSRLNVSVGARVSRGQLIAAVGSTGRSTAPHLHFETRKDGVPIDPREFLD